MNTYIVWVEGEYYLIVAAKTHSGAKCEYFNFTGNGWEAFEKTPEGVYIHVRLIEKDAPYEDACEITDSYMEQYGADLIMEGVVVPGWMTDEYCDYTWEYQYNRWDGFREYRRSEFEHDTQRQPADDAAESEGQT